LDEEGLDTNYQVILSTAIQKYPEAYKDRVFLTLTDDQRLLKKNPTPDQKNEDQTRVDPAT
jgi:hypothetical protein